MFASEPNSRLHRLCSSAWQNRHATQAIRVFSGQLAPRQSWILDSTLWIQDFRYWIPDSLTWGETTQHWSQHCDQGWLTEVVWEEQPSQLLAPRRYIGNGQNDASDEERGETAVFAGCDRRYMKCQPVHRNKPISGAGLFKAGLK